MDNENSSVFIPASHDTDMFVIRIDPICASSQAISEQ
jgi:hypothetical protein